MAARKVVFYRTRMGRCPIEDFLDSLSADEAKRVVWLLKLIADIERVPRGYFKKLQGTDGIWEGRIQHGGKAIRILGFLHENSFVGTNGFIKTTEKTPRRDIETAKRYKRDYYERRNKNG
jgi:phage-related protein